MSFDLISRCPRCPPPSSTRDQPSNLWKSFEDGSNEIPEERRLFLILEVESFHPAFLPPCIFLPSFPFSFFYIFFSLSFFLSSCCSPFSFSPSFFFITCEKVFDTSSHSPSSFFFVPFASAFCPPPFIPLFVSLISSRFCFKKMDGGLEEEGTGRKRRE